MRSWLLTIVLVALSLVGPGEPSPCASLELLVPAYANPCCGGGPEMWTRLVNAGLVLGGDIHIIFNPASGPGVGLVDPNYVNDVGEGPLVEFHATGGTVLGYIATSYAVRSLAEVEAEKVADRLAGAGESANEGANITYDRACIAAQLGDTDRALDLLRQHATLGKVDWVYMRIDPDLEPLSDNPTFQELVRPKG